METENILKEYVQSIYGKPADKKKCIGCDETENLEKCEGTMCRSCWEAENEEPDMGDMVNDNLNER